MRPIAGRETKVTMVAVRYASAPTEEVMSRLAHLRKAPNRKEAEIERDGLRRILRRRNVPIPRVALCANMACPCHLEES